VCEHGLLVDDHLRLEPAGMASSAATAGIRVAPSPADAPGHGEHEHCVFSTLLLQSTLGTDVSEVAAAPAPPARVLAVYRLAPKSSPPSIA
jgi:hypothetical protein